MSGWYKQQRDLHDRVWAKDAKMVSVYVYLHERAYVRDGMLHGQVIRRGSCPTSRAAIMESTGLTEEEVKMRLKNLKDYGEIIVKPTNKGMIITCCDYDGCNESEDLFGFNLSDEPTTKTTGQPTTGDTTQTTPHIEYKKEEYKNNLRSHSIPSKTERDNSKKLAYEIKGIYNKVFEGLLEEWKRLSDKMVIKVEICVTRFGRQSVDMVFEQIKWEHLNMNKSGFVPDFDFIFRVEQYERYLTRYKARVSRREKPAAEVAMKASTGSWLDAYNENQDWRPEEKQ